MVINTWYRIQCGSDSLWVVQSARSIPFEWRCQKNHVRETDAGGYYSPAVIHCHKGNAEASAHVDKTFQCECRPVVASEWYGSFKLYVLVA